MQFRILSVTVGETQIEGFTYILLLVSEATEEADIGCTGSSSAFAAFAAFAAFSAAQ
jgi:hypothetical protein